MAAGPRPRPKTAAPLPTRGRFSKGLPGVDLASYCEEKTTLFRCGQCQTEWQAMVWHCIDLGQDTHRAADAASGQLFKLACPHGHVAPAPSPVCLWRPDQAPGIVFWPCSLAPVEVPGTAAQYVQAFADRGTALDPASVWPQACLLAPDAEPVHERFTPHHVALGAPPRFYALFMAARTAQGAVVPGDVATLQDAAQAWEAIVAHRAFAAAPLWFRVCALAETGACHYRLYQAGAARGCIERSCRLFLDAMAAAGGVAMAQQGLRLNAGLAQLSSFSASGDPASLDGAVCLLVDNLPPPSDAGFSHLNGMALSAVSARWKLQREPSDLQTLRRLAGQAPEAGAHQQLLMAEAELAALQGDRPQLLKLYARCRDQSKRVAGRSMAQRAEGLSLAASIRFMAFDVGGLLADLDRALADAEKALDWLEEEPAGKKRHDRSTAPPRPNERLPELLANVADMRHRRFQAQGAMDDLEAASRLVRRALALDHPDRFRPTLLNTWGAVARDLYWRDRDPAWLKQAVLAFESASRLAPPGTRERLLCETNLGCALVDLYPYSNDPAHLDQAVQVLTQASTLAPRLAPDRADAVLNLASALMKRHARTGAAEDCQRAIQLYRGIDTRRLPPPDRLYVLSGLANALGQTKPLAGGPIEQEAVGLFRTGCATALQLAPWQALGLAKVWSRWATDRGAWAEADEAYQAGYQALERLDRAQSDRYARESWLADGQDLGRHGAYARLQLGDAEGAAVAVESTRVRLLTEQLALRSRRLEQLQHTGQSALLADYKRLLHQSLMRTWAQRAALSITGGAQGKRFARAGRGLNGSPDPFQHALLNAQEDQLQAERAELQGCVAQIRQQPGLESFLAPASFADVRAIWDAPAAPPTPLAMVYLVVATAGTAAIIIGRQTSQVVEIPGCTESWSEALIERLGYRQALLDDAPDWHALASTLAEVGAVVVAPLAAALASMAPPDPNAPTTIVLVSTGPLACVPLQACPYASAAHGSRTLLDDHVVTWGLSARVWHQARGNLGQGQGPHHLLAVGNPLPLQEDLPPLDTAAVEARAVATLFGTSTVLCEADATLDKVRKALPSATHLHLACHGHFDAETPSASEFVLAGAGRLNVAMLAAQDAGAVQLATLSACNSGAFSTEDLPEEVNGLATSLLEAGVPSCIASLWAVDDAVAPLLMLRMYELYQRRSGPLPSPAAHALRDAQRWLRDLTHSDLAAWLQAADGSPASAAAQLLVKTGIASRLLDEPGDRPFAAPYFWAGFVNFGA